MQEDTFKVMKLAKHVVPDDEVLESWQPQQEMIDSCRQKYQACSHAREKLMTSKLILAEATRDKFWGSGLNVAQTKECLTEYWPGQNVMGTILMELRAEFQSTGEVSEPEDGQKRKASSPLDSDLTKPSGNSSLYGTGVYFLSLLTEF